MSLSRVIYWVPGWLLFYLKASLPIIVLLVSTCLITTDDKCLDYDLNRQLPYAVVVLVQGQVAG